MKSTVNAFNRKTIFVFMFAWLAFSAAAQNVGDELIRPRVTRTHFAELCSAFEFGREQKRISELLFLDYTHEVSALAESIGTEARDAGRDRLDNALAGRERLSPIELQELRDSVAKIYAKSGPRALDAFNNLVSGIENILTKEQQLKFPRAVRLLRRQVLLHPQQENRFSVDYAGEGVDVLQLLQEARKEGGELYGISTESVNEIAESYELQLDQWLRESFIPVHIQGENVTHESELWSQLYELNQSTVRRVGELANAQLGKTAKQSWDHRFHVESFPWLFQTNGPDRIIEDIRQSKLSTELKSSAEKVYASFRIHHESLARAAIDLIVRARRNHNVKLPMQSSSHDRDRAFQELHEDFLKNSGEQETLSQVATTALEAILNQHFE